MAAKSASPESAQIIQEIGFTNLPDEWEIIRLESLLSSDRGIAVGVMYPGNNDAQGVPLIRAGDLTGDRIEPVANFRISFEKHAEYRRTELVGGELLISLVGDVGRCAIVPPEMAGWNAARAIAVLRFSSPSDASFVKFCLMSRPLQHLMRAWATTTVQATLNLKEIRQIPLPWPTSAHRDATVEILTALEDKIALNRRMNETLAATAKAIFKDWFVDFGPIRAKQEGRAPYLPTALWSIFPARLDDTGKPEGWVKKPLDEIANFLNGVALQKYPAVGDSFLPVIKIAQLRAGSADSSDRASLDVPAPYIIENGDVLFSWSGSLLHRIWTGGRGALNQHLFKVTSTNYPKWFFFHWIGHHMPAFQATAASKATTMGHIQRHHLSQAMTVVPDLAVMAAAHDIMGPLFDRETTNDIESRTLVATRDLILPKLMSGELRVKDAENAVREIM